MRKKIIYLALALIWVAIVASQIGEHGRVRNAAEKALVNRSRDFSLALGVVIRSQGRFGIIPQNKLEAALDELADSTDVLSVVLLNARGEITAASGEKVTGEMAPLLDAGEYWGDDRATFVNLVALGPNTESPFAVEGDTLMVAPSAGEGRAGHGPVPGGGPGGGPHPGMFGPFWDETLTGEQRAEVLGMMTGAPLTEDQLDRILDLFPDDVLDATRIETIRRTLEGRPLVPDTLRDALFLAFGSPRPGPRPEDDMLPRRPPWLSEEAFNRMQLERGIHWFLVTMSTAAVRDESYRDLRSRIVVMTVALLACLAIGIAWRTSQRSADLRVRLVRAEDMATHLRELNMAAAGLVHETKNPLNLIRGLAQMISRRTGESTATCETALRITEEADRVTGRLNQFLDYSRPVEPKLIPARIYPLAHRLFDILKPDTEEKTVGFRVSGPDVSVMADEDKLRQLLFNLLLNAVEAVPARGEIEVRLLSLPDGKCSIEVRDNGPGVPAEIEGDIFRPYFTTSARGTGLGLAVVRQIALAHGWDVQYIRELRAGAVFRVSGIMLAQGGNDQDGNGKKT